MKALADTTEQNELDKQTSLENIDSPKNEGEVNPLWISGMNTNIRKEAVKKLRMKKREDVLLAFGTTPNRHL